MQLTLTRGVGASAGAERARAEGQLKLSLAGGRIGPESQLSEPPQVLWGLPLPPHPKACAGVGRLERVQGRAPGCPVGVSEYSAHSSLKTQQGTWGHPQLQTAQVKPTPGQTRHGQGIPLNPQGQLQAWGRTPLHSAPRCHVPLPGLLGSHRLWARHRRGWSLPPHSLLQPERPGWLLPASEADAASSPQGQQD